MAFSIYISEMFSLAGIHTAAYDLRNDHSHPSNLRAQPRPIILNNSTPIVWAAGRKRKLNRTRWWGVLYRLFPWLVYNVSSLTLASAGAATSPLYNNRCGRWKSIESWWYPDVRLSYRCRHHRISIMATDVEWHEVGWIGGEGKRIKRKWESSHRAIVM